MKGPNGDGGETVAGAPAAPSSEDAAPVGVEPDRLAGLGVLAGGVVHELGGSLAVLVTNLTVATEQLLALQAAPQGEREPPPELGASLGEALEAAQRLRSLVGDLKTFARVELPGGPPADLRAALGSVLRLLEFDLRQRARLTLDFGPVARVAIHEARLAALLLQVFVLVLQRLPREQPSPLAVRVGQTSQGPELVVAFDVALQTLPPLEERALQATFAYCRGLCAQLGAHLDESRTPAGAALLRLRLPATTQSTRPPSDPTMMAVLPLPRVLVIDDEPLLCEAVRRMLAGEAQVEATNSPADGLARLLAGERFEAILCDVLMPVMNGVELFTALEAQRPDLAARLGFVTGGAFAEETQAFLSANAERVLEKPFSRSGLRTLLRALLAGRFVKPV
jgi:CheY-like chemotaxis protein